MHRRRQMIWCLKPSMSYLLASQDIEWNAQRALPETLVLRGGGGLHESTRPCFQPYVVDAPFLAFGAGFAVDVVWIDCAWLDYHSVSWTYTALSYALKVIFCPLIADCQA